MTLLRLLIPVLLCVAGWAHAGQPGETLPVLQLADQHGQRLVVDAGVRRIFFTHDMAGGKLLKAALGEQGQRSLDAIAGVAIADVSGMPAMIRQMMAMPALKKRSYRIGIDETGKQVVDLPRQPGQVTVIDLDGLKILTVRYAADEKTLASLVAP